MPRSRRASIGLAIAFATIAAARPARADEPAVVPFEISATQPGSSIEVRGRGRAFAGGERCVLQLPQHDYRVIVRDRDGNESATALTIMKPVRLTVASGNQAAKRVGIGLFVGGLAATVVGAAALSFALFVPGDCSVRCDGRTRLFYGGGLSVVTGAGLGATGIIVWKASAHARVVVSPLALTGNF